MNQAANAVKQGNVAEILLNDIVLDEKSLEKFTNRVGRQGNLAKRIKEEIIPDLTTSAGKIEESANRIGFAGTLLEHFAPGVASSAKDMATVLSGAAEEINEDFKGMKRLSESLIKEFEIVIDDKRCFIENLDELCAKEREINFRRLREKMDEVDQTETIVKKEHAIRMAKLRNDAVVKSLEFGDLKARLATLAAEKKEQTVEISKSREKGLGHYLAVTIVVVGVILSTIMILHRCGII